jgi:hypothetical protein
MAQGGLIGEGLPTHRSTFTASPALPNWLKERTN